MDYLIDLRSRTSAIGDQGRRPTCVSFALSACHEFIHGLPPRELSKDALHRGCVERDGAALGGVKVATALNVLIVDGQPYEDDWAYRGDLEEMAWMSLPCPDLDGRPRFKIAGCKSIQITSPEDLAEVLTAFGPLLVVVPIWSSFFIPHSGRIEMPDTKAEEFRGNHALCVVGVSSDGNVLARNSWGTSWGDCGHVLIPFDYLREYARVLCALSIKETER